MVVDDSEVIKVAVVLPSFSVGGAENMVALLVSRLNPNKVKAKVFCLCGEPLNNALESSVRCSDVEICHIGKKDGFSPRSLAALFRELDLFSPDVVHSHAFPCMYCAPWALFRGVPLLHTIHTTPEVEASRAIRKKMMGGMYKHKKAFPVAISEVNRRKTAEFYSLALDDVYMIRNPVDLKKYELPSEGGRSGKRFVITIVASLIPVKNHECLLRAFVTVYRNHPECRLWVIGDGSLKSDLMDLSDCLGISKAVKFWGLRDDVSDLLKDSDVFVLSSLYEGSPMSIIEAMAAGLPVVATNVGGVPDLVSDSNGILVEPNDDQALAHALVSLVEDGSLRRSMGKASKKNSRRYDAEIVAEQYERLYAICSEK